MHPRAYIDTRLRVSQSACGNAHGETPFSLPRYFGAFVTSSHCGLQTTAVPPATLRSTRPQPIPQAQRAGTAWCLKHLRSLALSPAETRTTARRLLPHRCCLSRGHPRGEPTCAARMSYTILLSGTTMAQSSKTQLRIEGRPVWAEISTSALTYNLRALRAFVNPPNEKRKTPRKVLSIVKGNGYGHGGPQVAKILEKAGSDWFGVTCTNEGIDVRKAGVRKPILVLTSFWPGEEAQLLKHDLTAVIHRCEQLELLDRAAARRGGKKRVPFHLKIDTGMNRLGIASGDVECFARQLGKCKNVHLTGIFS